MTERVVGRTYKIPLAELTHDEQNANTHSKRSVESLAASLKQFGQQKPIVATADGVVMAGNGMLEAAKLLEWERIEVRITELNGDALRAFAIADNRLPTLSSIDSDVLQAQLEELYTADWPDMESLGYTDKEIDAMLSAPAPNLDAEPEWEDDPNVPDEPESPSTGAAVVCTQQQYAVIRRAVDMVRREERTNEISEGRALELICADYLAGDDVEA